MPDPIQPATDLPDQPDGIEDDSRDLPNPTTAAERVGQYICAAGDGLYDIQGGAPLYARDLEALTRTATKLPDLQEELSRRTHTLDLARRELGATREEADRFAAELASANQQIATTKTHFTRRTDTLTTRAERAEAERDQLRYERRLLGTCRVFLDGLAKTAQSVNLQRAATDLAQRIVDEIGHPVTDEPALGPELRTELARVTAERDRLRGELEFAQPDATSYRQLADALQATMTDPDRWDGEDAEIAIMLRYVQHLAADLAKTRTFIALDLRAGDTTEDIEEIIETWYANWPDTAVTTPHYPLAVKILNHLADQIEVTASVPGSSRRAPEPAEPAPAMPAPGEHLWERFGRLTSCRWCGIIERYDGANKPCKGRVHVELRAAECRDLLSAQHAVVRAAIIWRKMRAGITTALAVPQARALSDAVDALADAVESQASEPAPADDRPGAQETGR